MARRISATLPAFLAWLVLGTVGLHAQSIAQNYPGEVGIWSLSRHPAKTLTKSGHISPGAALRE